MAGESLIAVKDAAGNWGYCDQSGALVIPCIYQPQMSLSIMNETVEYPYADLSGMVVVKINPDKSWFWMFTAMR